MRKGVSEVIEIVKARENATCAKKGVEAMESEEGGWGDRALRKPRLPRAALTFIDDSAARNPPS